MKEKDILREIIEDVAKDYPDIIIDHSQKGEEIDALETLAEKNKGNK